MKSFIISILPFVSMAIRTSSADTPKSGVKLLTTKKISLLFIFIFFFTVKTFSQTPDDGMKKIEGCFSAVKMDLKTNTIAISKTFCVGDKITVKLEGDKIHGKISKLSKNYIVVADKDEIDVSKIKWIKNSKLTASRAIASVLVTAAGVALVASAPEAGTFEHSEAIGLTGMAIVPIGIVIFVSRTKFRVERGDKLIFIDQPSQISQIQL